MTSLINILLIMTHTLPQLPYAEDALAPKMRRPSSITTASTNALTWTI